MSAHVGFCLRFHMWLCRWLDERLQSEKESHELLELLLCTNIDFIYSKNTYQLHTFSMDVAIYCLQFIYFILYIFMLFSL